MVSGVCGAAHLLSPTLVDAVSFTMYAPMCLPCGCRASMQENLKLSPAMLSRFDLIFVLLDRPDELMDQALSEHIMALHSGKSSAQPLHPPTCAAHALLVTNRQQPCNLPATINTGTIVANCDPCQNHLPVIKLVLPAPLCRAVRQGRSCAPAAITASASAST